MRRLISLEGRIAVVTAALVVALSQLGRLPALEPYYPVHARPYLAVDRTCSAAAAADVVLLGDSRVMSGVLPWVLSRELKLAGLRGEAPRVVSLALPGATPDVELWLWRRLVRSGARAKVVIAGITETSLKEGGPTRDYALRYLFRSRDALWLLSRGHITDAATLLTYRVFPLYARQTAVRNVLWNRRPAIPGAAQWRALRGPVLVLRKQDYLGYRVDRFAAESVEQLVRETHRRGAAIFLVAPPVERVLLVEAAQASPARAAPRWRILPRSNPGAGGSAFDLVARIAANCARRRGAVFLNYATLQQSARFHYRDPAHLSDRGARVFSHLIAGRINSELARHTREKATSRR
jgi:hypothetical protein